MARFITETKEADYVFTVKKKQPTMFEDIESLPWEGFPPRQTFSTLDKGHGRIERRTLTVSSELKEVFPEFSFPGHQQVFRLELNTSNLDGSPPPHGSGLWRHQSFARKSLSRTTALPRSRSLGNRIPTLDPGRRVRERQKRHEKGIR